MAEYTKEYLLDHLKKGTGTVIFQKVSGELREMSCTLVEETINEYTTNTDANGNVGTHSDGILDNVKKDKRAVNPNLMIVFDIEKRDWRSFRVDSVKSFDWIAD